jgi:hypothetical protein
MTLDNEVGQGWTNALDLSVPAMPTHTMATGGDASPDDDITVMAV